MKGLIVASLSFLFLVALAILLLRRNKSPNYLGIFFRTFAWTIPFYVVLYRMSKPDLGFLGDSWVFANGWLDFLNGLLILVMLFHCFVDVTYATVITGFSNNLILYMARPEGISLQEVKEIYGAGDEGDPVVQNRLEQLVQRRYAERCGEDSYRVLPKGRRLAWIAAGLQRIWRIGGAV
ncbi:MAG: hypothetical protein Q8R76_05130 [Candidatus Omnitrophota bacterium]|nr:hypothetical protein [Candidatus Omnitrophota bacterium]